MVTLKDRFKQLNELKQLTENQPQFVPPPAEDSSSEFIIDDNELFEENDVDYDKNIDKGVGDDNKEEPAEDNAQLTTALLADDGDIVSQYRKMLKMGMSAGAVEQKMRADDVDQRIIDAVFVVEEPTNEGVSDGTVEKGKEDDEQATKAPGLAPGDDNVVSALEGHETSVEGDESQSIDNNQSGEVGGYENDKDADDRTERAGASAAAAAAAALSPPPQEGTDVITPPKSRTLPTSVSNRGDGTSKAVQCIIAVLCLIALGVSLYFLLPVILDESSPSTRSSIAAPSVSAGGNPGEFAPTLSPGEPSEPSRSTTLSPLPTLSPTFNVPSLPTDNGVDPSNPTEMPSQIDATRPVLMTEPPTKIPTKNPTVSPTNTSTKAPTPAPTTQAPTKNPTGSPTRAPAASPATPSPTKNPTISPTKTPTKAPTPAPTTQAPTKNPTSSPTRAPTATPSTPSPTMNPTSSPTKTPTKTPTSAPITPAPTSFPTKNPTKAPTRIPTFSPTTSPPTKIPTGSPTEPPTKTPTKAPTFEPVTSLVQQLEVISGAGVFDNANSPQSFALDFLRREGYGDELVEDRRVLERYAALVFYYSTGGESSWFQCFKGHLNCGSRQWLLGGTCNWQFLSCNNAGIVTSFTIDFNNGLSGPIPIELSVFSELREFALLDNRMQGSLPELFKENESQLRVLRLENSGLEGTIPPGFLNKSPVESLVLSGLKIVGSIPEDIYDLTGLQQLYLNENADLTGSISPSINKLSNLVELRLSDTRVGGRIPDEIFKLRRIEEIDLSNADFRGPISNSFVSISDSLNRLYLHNNAFVGTVPASFGMLNKLTELTLHDNLLSGNISPTICALNLRTLTTSCDEVSCSCCTMCF
ncbi:unnamed protein product [Cylindrotheca closterium]|uniref:L domain-like protein n=1 Tax=Cylindrotheca closterium TaxID=2856 RepID=A0AAD2FYK2_9STRA|nr:unnamed protein product [Cylindrotheca closterium]